MTVSIEPAQAQDLSVLVEMATAFHLEDGHALGPEAVRAIGRLARAEPLAPTWVAWNQGRPVGYAVLAVCYSVEYGGPAGYIDDLYVIPDARSLGVGRKLLEHVVQQAKSRGMVALQLEIQPDNSRASQLYEKIGFEFSQRRSMNLDLR